MFYLLKRGSYMYMQMRYMQMHKFYTWQKPLKNNSNIKIKVKTSFTCDIYIFLF